MSEEMLTGSSSEKEEVEEIVVSGRQHLVRILGMALAKHLVDGRRVVVVRCEEILWRVSATTPTPSESPVKILWRSVRGFLPLGKMADRAAVLGRFKAYEGVPPPYHNMKHVVVPQAVKTRVVLPGDKYYLLGSLSKEVGWRRYDTIKDLEESLRREKAKEDMWKQLQMRRRRRRPKVACECKPNNDQEELQVLNPLLSLSLNPSPSPSPTDQVMHTI